MMTLTIEASVSEPMIVDIGSASRTLQRRLVDKINDKHMKAMPDVDHKCQLNLATKTAVVIGWRLEISWAETPAELVRDYEGALIQAHLSKHCRMPSFKHPQSGEWILGNQRVEPINSIVSELDWNAWRSMHGLSRGDIPTVPGVYRIRAVQLSCSATEC